MKKNLKIRKILTKKKLSYLYINLKWASLKICKKYHCSIKLIMTLLEEYNIPKRNNKEARRLCKYPIFNKYKFSKIILKKLYITRQLSSIDIAKIFKCSSELVLIYLNKFKIPRRKVSEFRKGKKHSEETKRRISESNKVTKAKIKHYYEGKKNPFFGKSHSKTTKLKISQSRQNQCLGIKNPNWQGGISLLPYSYKFTHKLKEKIRKRDNFTCQCCGMTEEQNVKKFKRKLDIHHIDYDKQNDNKNNLISLCKLCHSKTNGNRDYWYAFYTYIMENKI